MKKLLVLSGKGGTGKTTITSAFIHFENAKAYADCDVDAPNLHLVMQQENEPKTKEFIGSKKAFIQPDLCQKCGACVNACRFQAIEEDSNSFKVKEQACEGCGVCKLVCPHHAITMGDDISGQLLLFENEKVFSTATLKMGRGNSGKLVSEVKKELFQNTTDASLAIIDGSPGIGCPVIASVSGVDVVLLVTEPSISGFHDLKRVLKSISCFGVKILVCVNKFDVNLEQTKEIKHFCHENAIPFVGEIPYDPQVTCFMNKGETIVNYHSKVKEALYNIYLETKKYL